MIKPDSHDPGPTSAANPPRLRDLRMRPDSTPSAHLTWLDRPRGSTAAPQRPRFLPNAKDIGAERRCCIGPRSRATGTWWTCCWAAGPTSERTKITGGLDSPLCECGYARETVEHYLLECPSHKEPRKKLRKNVGFGRMKVGKLFGDIKILKHMLKYVYKNHKKTGIVKTKEIFLV